MLREHGAHRPSVFEILNQVHQLRGTKSQFHYNIPTPVPLSPRQSKPVMTVERVRQSNHNSKPAVTATVSPAKNAGVQAREKVLEAIEPMRRGRPTPSSKATSSTSRSSSPQKELKHSQGNKDWLSPGFDTESDKAWKTVTVQDLGRSNMDDVWSLGAQNKPKIDKSDLKKEAFGDDFGGKLWDSFDHTSRFNAELLPAHTPLPAALSRSMITPSRSAAITGLNEKPGSTLRSKDAFEGLGLTRSSERQAPTLGEARKLRTGLAMISSHAQESNKASLSLPAKPASTPSYQSQSLSPAPPLHPTASGSSWSSQPPASRPQSSSQADGLPAEARYPSLEELDARFESPSKPQLSPTGKPSPSSRTEVPSSFQQSDIIKPPTTQAKANVAPNLASPSDNSVQRPSLVRKHRSSVIIKHNPPLGAEDLSQAGSGSTYVTENTPKLPPRPTANKDWLTGDDGDAPSSRSLKTEQSDAPKLRESPSKRASYVVQTSVQPRSVFHDEVSLTGTESSSASMEKFTRIFPALDPAGHQNTSHRSAYQEKELEPASSADEGPEDASGYNPNSSKTKNSDRPRRKGRQSSVHDLVDLWGGGVGSPTKEKEQAVRSTITPASYKPAGGNTGQKRRSTALPTLSTMKQSNPLTSQSMLSPPDSGKSSMSSAGASKQTPSAVSSPTSARSRPQSMFIFPSKSTDASPIPSPGLLPPEEPKARTNVRRSSISDMVQRYEAIGTRSGPAPPPKPSTLTAPNGRLRTSPAPSQVFGSDSKSSQVNGGSTSSLTLPDDDISSASKPSSRTSPSSPLPETTRAEGKEGTTRSRRTSLKPESSTFSPKKSATEDASTRLPEPRSPSPERPYQGVGKLIDQWQRKVEADSAKSVVVPKRGGLVAKRAGLVNGSSTTRGQ